MAIEDIKHKAEELAGKAKQAVGQKTDDHDLEAEGAKQETTGQVKQVGDKVKDVFNG